MKFYYFDDRTKRTKILPQDRVRVDTPAAVVEWRPWEPLPVAQLRKFAERMNDYSIYCTFDDADRFAAEAMGDTYLTVKFSDPDSWDKYSVSKSADMPKDLIRLYEARQAALDESNRE